MDMLLLLLCAPWPPGGAVESIHPSIHVKRSSSPFTQKYVFRLQVVDIVSTWRSLGPDLRCDSRPPMVKAVSQLLALVPQLAVKSEEYQVPAKVVHACKNNIAI